MWGVSAHTADSISQFAGLVATFLTFESVRDFTHAVMPTTGVAAAFKLLIPMFLFLFIYDIFARIRDNKLAEKKEPFVSAKPKTSWVGAPRTKLSTSFSSLGSFGDLSANA